MSSEEEQYEQALRAVETGDHTAKTQLAWFLLTGRGGAVVDADAAVVLLEERTKDGDPEAMWMLGLCNKYGFGTEENSNRARDLFLGSSEAGSEIGKVIDENWFESWNESFSVPCL